MADPREVGRRAVAFDEIQDRVRKLNDDEGLVDLKAGVDVSNHTSQRDLMVVLNHSLKAREEGRYIPRASFTPEDGQEYLQVAQGIAELDRGESVDLDEVLEKAHAIVDDIESKRFGR